MTSLAAPLGTQAYFLAALQGFQQSMNNVNQSVGRLASGDRIQNPGDDVASFSVAAGLQSQISGLTQANSNAAQAISLVQVAAGGLKQIGTLLSNLQNIATQGTSTSLTTNQRSFLQEELTQNLSQINSIANSTTFNGINLLTHLNTTFQVGAQSTNTISFNLSSLTTSSLFGATLPSVQDTSHAASAQTAITTASNTVQSLISYVGGVESSLNAASSAITTSIGGITAANSNLVDTDIPAETSALAQETLQVNSAAAVIAQARTLPPQLLLLLNPLLAKAA